MELYFTKLTENNKITIPNSYRKLHNLDENSILYIIEVNEERNYMMLSPNKPTYEDIKTLSLDSVGRINYLLETSDVHINIEIYENNNILFSTHAINYNDEKIRYKRGLDKTLQVACSILLPSAIISELDITGACNLDYLVDENIIKIGDKLPKKTGVTLIDKLGRVNIPAENIKNCDFYGDNKAYVELNGRQINIYKI